MKSYLKKPIVLIKGAGDIATGVAYILSHENMSIVMTEIDRPTTERRGSSFSEAIYSEEINVDGLIARKTDLSDILKILNEGKIPVIIDPKTEILEKLKPNILIDAIMAKKNLGTQISDAKLVIGLGPGFSAGDDVHAVIETCDGDDLGSPIYSGRAKSHTGIPCEIMGQTEERALRALESGKIKALKKIGDQIEKGEVVAKVGESDVVSKTSGVLRGIMKDGICVEKNRKIGDIDPRGDPKYCFSIAERSIVIGLGAHKAINELMNEN